MIDITTLTEDDRGRMILVFSGDEPLAQPLRAVLVNWNEYFLFAAWPNQAPASGGHCDPYLCSFTEGRAAPERTEEGILWRLPKEEARS